MLKSLHRTLKRIAAFGGDRGILSDLPPQDREIIALIRHQKLTYLSKKRLAAVARTCRAIDDAGTPGIFVEAGCALGGSTILIARVKQDSRRLFVYDVFGMIPPPAEGDTQDVHQRYRSITEGKAVGIGGDPYYGYQPNLYELVKANLASCGIDRERQSVSLIKGLVQETMNIDRRWPSHTWMSTGTIR